MSTVVYAEHHWVSGDGPQRLAGLLRVRLVPVSGANSPQIETGRRVVSQQTFARLFPAHAAQPDCHRLAALAIHVPIPDIGMRRVHTAGAGVRDDTPAHGQRRLTVPPLPCTLPHHKLPVANFLR